MRPIISDYFLQKLHGNKYNSFQDLHDPRKVFFFYHFYGTYERGLVIIITMACDISI